MLSSGSYLLFTLSLAYILFMAMIAIVYCRYVPSADPSFPLATWLNYCGLGGDLMGKEMTLFLKKLVPNQKVLMGTLVLRITLVGGNFAQIQMSIYLPLFLIVFRSGYPSRCR